MEQSYDLLSNDLSLNSISQDNLFTAAKWAKFLAIIGFIFCGLMIVGGFAMSAYLSNYSSSTYGYKAFPFNPAFLSIFYIILSIILFFPCLFLLKFSNKMQEAIKTSSQDSLDNSFMNLKSLFKFYGIMTIVILSFYAIAIIFAVIGFVAR